MKRTGIFATIGLVVLVATGGSAWGGDQEPREERVYRIAQEAPNRIVTPYDNPTFVTNVPHEAWTAGRAIYLLPMDDVSVLGGFVQDETGQYAIPVMFEVARVPPQNIHLEDPAYQRVVPGDPLPINTNDHVDHVVETLLAAFRQEAIPGFRPVGATNDVVYVGPIRMELEHSQRRGDIRVDRHRIVNEGIETRRISEASFEAANRLGVMVYPPMTEIAPNQEAHVFIMRRQAR